MVLSQPAWPSQWLALKLCPISWAMPEMRVRALLLWLKLCGWLLGKTPT